MMRLNVKSALYGMQEVLPHFKERNVGQVINISSMLGRIPFVPFRSAYCAAKHFLNSLTATFRAEVQATHPRHPVHAGLTGRCAHRLRPECAAWRRRFTAIPGVAERRGSGGGDCHSNRVAAGRHLHATGCPGGNCRLLRNGGSRSLSQSRRDFLRNAAAIGGAAVVPGWVPEAIARALAINPAAGTTFLDAEHIVVLMQENRSFDHSYGALRGVRGFRDPRVHVQPNGQPVCSRPMRRASPIRRSASTSPERMRPGSAGCRIRGPTRSTPRNGGRYDNMADRQAQARPAIHARPLWPPGHSVLLCPSPMASPSATRRSARRSPYHAQPPLPLDRQHPARRP